MLFFYVRKLSSFFKKCVLSENSLRHLALRYEGIGHLCLTLSMREIDSPSAFDPVLCLEELGIGTGGREWREVREYCLVGHVVVSVWSGQ